MKSSLLFALAASALFGGSVANAAPEPGPIAEFAGNYRGNFKFSVAGTPYRGKSYVKFSAPPSGNSGVAVVKSSFSTGGATYDTGNVFRFGNDKFSVQRFVPPLAETPIQRGRLRASRRSLRGSSNPDPMFPGMTTTVKATLQKTPRIAKLNLVYTVFSGGFPAYIYTYTGTRRLRPSE